MFLDVALHFAEERHHGAAAILAELASDEVERLHAIGAFVDHGNACIAHELFHALFGDIAMTAENLLRLHRVGKPPIGQNAFNDGRK